MWNFLIALFIGRTVGDTHAARRLVKPILTLFAIGILVAGLIYTYVVFKAVTERSHAPHVHAQSIR